MAAPPTVVRPMSGPATLAAYAYGQMIAAHRRQIIYQPAPRTAAELQRQTRELGQHERALAILGRAAHAELHPDEPMP